MRPLARCGPQSFAPQRAQASRRARLPSDALADPTPLAARAIACPRPVLISSHLTNEMGDSGFLVSVIGWYRSHVYLSDVVRLGGRVAGKEIDQQGRHGHAPDLGSEPARQRGHARNSPRGPAPPWRRRRRRASAPHIAGRLPAGREVGGGGQVGLLLEVIDPLSEGVDGGFECLGAEHHT